MESINMLKQNIVRKVFIIALLLIALIVQAQKKSSILLGNWTVIKTTSADLSIPLTKEESRHGLGIIVIFKLDKIIVHNNDCFNGCDRIPKYKSRSVNALKYYNNDVNYIKMLGCSTGKIHLVNTGCGLPYEEINIINKNLIVMSIDGYCYFLKRIVSNASNLAPKGQ